MNQADANNDEKKEEIATQSQMAAARMKARQDVVDVWNNPDVAVALMDEEKTLEKVKMTSDPLLHVDSKLRNNIIAMEVLATAATVKDLTNPTELINYCEMLVSVLAENEKDYIMTVIAPSSDEYRDIRRCLALIDKDIKTIEELAYAAANMVSKAKKQEGVTVGTFRSAKRLILALRMMVASKITKTKMIPYLKGIEDAKSISSDMCGFTVKTQRNYVGYINTVHFLRNAAFWARKLMVIKKHYKNGVMDVSKDVARKAIAPTDVLNAYKSGLDATAEATAKATGVTVDVETEAVEEGSDEEVE